jgi:enolase-phosphatase E1
VSPDVRAVLLDIEGTTTSVRFVYDVLFPYARENMADFLRASSLAEIDLLRAEHLVERPEDDPPPWSETTPDERTRSATRYALWLMDRDRKSTALKAVQGRIWERGYRDGRLRGHVYDDVPRALARWKRQGLAIHIFSSGSVLAQKLIFGRSTAGDLLPSIDGHFDTTTGPKREPSSYARIAAAMGQPPDRVLFVSDVEEELDAAAAAGLRTALVVREGRAPAGARHRVVRDLDGILDS